MTDVTLKQGSKGDDMTIKATSGSALTYLESYFTTYTSSYNKTMDQLTSGKKNPETRDNPVEVCKSARFAMAISANAKASDNVALGTDLLKTAEGMQETVTSNLNKIRDLCIQAANGTYSASEKDGIILEIKSRLSYINGLSDSANFNKINILDGSNPNLTLQIDAHTSATLNVGNALIDTHTGPAALNIDFPVGETGATWTNTDINNYITQVENAKTTVLTATETLGAYQNRLDFATDRLNSVKVNLTSAKSTITDTDTAEASSNLVKYQVLQQASISILAQANQIPSMALSLLK